MGCYQGHGHRGHGCWGPGECRDGPDPEGYWSGYNYRRNRGYEPLRRALRPGSRETAAAQLEAYLASLKDDIRAIEADLAELRAGGEPGSTAPQV